MSTLPSQWLGEIGLAEFGPIAIADAETYTRMWARTQTEVAADEESFQAFIEFGATEFSLAPAYRGSFSSGPGEVVLMDIPEPNLDFPVHVGSGAVADAIYKTDCGPFMEHSRKDYTQLRPWDVFTFAGDMSKLELFGISDDINVLADPKIMQTVVDTLAERYIKAGLGSRVVESGLLAAQGLIWFAKLALLRGEDYTQIHNLPFAARFSPGQAMA